MSRRRVVVANAVIAVILVGHLAALAAQKEDWPFSNYPMYSQRRDAWVGDSLAFDGVVAGSSEHVELDFQALTSPYYAWGFDDAVEEALDEGDGRIEEILAAVLVRYDDRRSDDPELPELDEIDLVRFTYELDPDRTDPAPVVGREVIASYHR